MKTVNYDKNALKIISEVSRIVKTKDGNTPVKIVKDDEGIHIKAGNGPKTLVFTLDAPSESFNFEGDNICFYNYEEFFNFFSMMDEPTIYQGVVNEGEANETEAVVIANSNNRRRVVYPLASQEVIKGHINKVGWKNTDASFILTTDNLVQLKKVVGLLNGKSNNISFSFANSEVNVIAKTNANDNTYEDVFALTEPVEEEFSITISDEVFKFLSNIDYTVEVSKVGVIRLNFEIGAVAVSIFVTSIEEE